MNPRSEAIRAAAAAYATADSLLGRYALEFQRKLGSDCSPLGVCIAAEGTLYDLSRGERVADGGARVRDGEPITRGEYARLVRAIPNFLDVVCGDGAVGGMFPRFLRDTAVARNGTGLRYGETTEELLEEALAVLR